MTDSIIARYSCEEFFAAQAGNTHLPNELEELCKTKPLPNEIRSDYIEEVKLVIDSYINPITDGKGGLVQDPNHVYFINHIRDILNKVNNENVDHMLHLLGQENYRSELCFITLANELINKFMTDVQHAKSLDRVKTSLSDAYIVIVDKFQRKLILNEEIDGVTKEKEVFFRKVFVSCCCSVFKKYISGKEPLDNTNQYRIDGFKCFMNMMGMLFSNRIINYNIISGCTNDIIKLMFNNSSTKEIAKNIHMGYIKMMQQVIEHFRNKENIVASDVEILEKIISSNKLFNDENKRFDFMNSIMDGNHKKVVKFSEEIISRFVPVSQE